MSAALPTSCASSRQAASATRWRTGRSRARRTATGRVSTTSRECRKRWKRATTPSGAAQNSRRAPSATPPGRFSARPTRRPQSSANATTPSCARHIAPKTRAATSAGARPSGGTTPRRSATASCGSSPPTTARGNITTTTEPAAKSSASSSATDRQRRTCPSRRRTPVRRHYQANWSSPPLFPTPSSRSMATTLCPATLAASRTSTARASKRATWSRTASRRSSPAPGAATLVTPRAAMAAQSSGPRNLEMRPPAAPYPLCPPARPKFGAPPLRNPNHSTFQLLNHSTFQLATPTPTPSPLTKTPTASRSSCAAASSKSSTKTASFPRRPFRSPAVASASRLASHVPAPPSRHTPLRNTTTPTARSCALPRFFPPRTSSSPTKSTPTTKRTASAPRPTSTARSPPTPGPAAGSCPPPTATAAPSCAPPRPAPTTSTTRRRTSGCKRFRGNLSTFQLFNLSTLQPAAPSA